MLNVSELCSVTSLLLLIPIKTIHNNTIQRNTTQYSPSKEPDLSFTPPSRGTTWWLKSSGGKKRPRGSGDRNGEDFGFATAVPAFAFATSEVTFHIQQQGKTKTNIRWVCLSILIKQVPSFQ